MAGATIIIALGSNRRHGRFGGPRDVVRAAVARLAREGLPCTALSPVFDTRAIGPGGRNYANAVMTSESSLAPVQIWTILQKIEREFGRRGGRRWGARVLDLDLIACGAGVWPSRLRWGRARGLRVPHCAMHRRAFVLRPMLAVAPQWRHPVLGLTTRQLLACLDRRRGAP